MRQRLSSLQGFVESKHANPSVKRGPKRGQNSSREGDPRLMNSSFSGFIHFPRKRTLCGWALLFAMGKHTSKQFLYGRKHSRISKCPKTRSKTGVQTGPKRGPDQHPKSKKHRYTGKSSLQRGLKKGPKWGSKTVLKWWSKVRAKSRPGRRCQHRILVRRALA